MPGYKAHLAVGSAVCGFAYVATISLFKLPTLPQLPLCIVLGLVGSVFPDIDIRSKMQKFYYRGATLGVLVTLFLQAWTLFFILAAISCLITTLTHRTMTHHYWFLTATPLLIVLYVSHWANHLFYPGLTYSLFFIFGALSHVVLDRSITKIKNLYS
jgi:hypothetical protein